MPSVSQIIKMRERRRKKVRRDPSGRFGLSCSGVLSLLAATGFIWIALSYISLTRDLPSQEILPALLEPPDGALLEPTRIYDRTGEKLLLSLENPAATGRNYLQIHAPASSGLTKSASGLPAPSFFPNGLISATVANLDPQFWNHRGFELSGLRQGSHGTLAQRLVNDLILWDEPPGLRRALRERLLAAQITTRYGREKVLEWYLNSADYGALLFGADAAARAYFGKPASELSLAESALLAAVADAPALNPFEAPETAIERQKQVLDRMLDLGLIEPEEALAAKKEDLRLQEPATQEENPAQTFIDLALTQVQTQISRSRLERGGLEIITTMDYDLQLQTACAAKTQVERLSTSGAPSSTEQIFECQAARLLPTLPGSSGAHPEAGAEVVVMDPSTGEILALSAQSSSDNQGLPQSAHPGGSLLTPFIYLSGFTRGMSPASLVWDVPTPMLSGEVQNFDNRHHGPIRLRTALANDYLIPAMKVVEQLGPESVWRTAQKFGLASLNIPAGEAAYRVPLNGGEIPLLEISQAYGVFANGGSLVGRQIEPEWQREASSLQPLTVQKVVDGAGRNWLDWRERETRPVINTQLAYVMTQVLSDEAARWPSMGHPNALEIGRPAAAKLGQTQDQTDAWSIGYTPQLLVGVWIGAQDSGSLDQPKAPINPNAAAALWHAIIQYATRDLPSLGWNEPPGISKIEVCEPSGLLPTEDCPNTVAEIFLPGSEPTHVDNLYRRVQINRENGLLATVFTPPNLIEERTFMMIAPEAEIWAETMGIPIPPETYDVVRAEKSDSPGAKIESPEMYASIQGKIAIRGAATGDGFQFYRLQVGQGLNPEEWIQIGQDTTRPVSGGLLGTWDTAGLNGLYVVQLLVIRDDQQVDTDLILVTVDNRAPEIQILYPGENEEVQLSPSRKVTLQIDVRDDLAVEQVRIFIDDRLLTTLIQPPYAFPWEAVAGEHSLRIEAEDRAGNTSEAEIDFLVK